MKLTEEQQDLLDKLFACMYEDLSNDEIVALTLTVLGIEFGLGKYSEIVTTLSKCDIEPKYRNDSLNFTLAEASEFINECYDRYLEIL